MVESSSVARPHIPSCSPAAKLEKQSLLLIHCPSLDRALKSRKINFLLRFKIMLRFQQINVIE